MTERQRRIAAQINREAAQEYQRLQNRLRSEPDHELEWPFPLTREDRLFVTAIAWGNWSAAGLKWEDA